MQRIKSVTFQNSMHRYGNKAAVALMDDGSEVEEIVFYYFDDELEFSEHDLLGLTLEEARDLKHLRDVEYLRS